MAVIIKTAESMEGVDVVVNRHMAENVSEMVVADIQSDKPTTKISSNNLPKQVLIKITAKEENDSLQSKEDKGTSLKYK